MMGPNQEKTLKEIEKFSKKDAQSYIEYDKMLSTICEYWEKLVDKEPPNIKIFSENISFKEKLETFKTLSFIAKESLSISSYFPSFLEIVTSPASKILNKWFESEPLKATLATGIN